MRYTREDGCRAWLTQAMIPPSTLLQLFEQFGSAEAIYEEFLDSDTTALQPYITPKSIRVLKQYAPRDEMHKIMLAMNNAQMQIMAYSDPIYPDSLRNLDDPPVLLFYRGNPNCLRGRCVTMIGSRKASPTVMEDTRRIAYDLAQADVTVVSGLALGIDSAAHRGCLDAHGRTVGVMACGLDVDYPHENADLRDEIIRSGGVLLSESPPGSPVYSWRIPVRNRILSGLSTAVLMMECRVRSGSMTTVNHALRQGRDVFAYPGVSGTEWAEGAQTLLNEGATAFTSAHDVLAELNWVQSFSAEAIRSRQPRAVRSVTLRQSEPQQQYDWNEAQQAIMQQLEEGEQSYDQLAAATGLSASVLSGELTMLQLLGCIKAMPGKIFRRI